MGRPPPRKQQGKPKLTPNMVRELQVLRSENETLKHEAAKATASAREASSKAAKTTVECTRAVAQYKRMYNDLLDLVKKQAPAVAECWFQSKHTSTRKGAE